MSLTEAQIAERAGTSPARVRDMVELGIISRGPDPEAPFRSGDAMRVQLIEELVGFGIPLPRIAEAMSSGALSLSYLDFYPDPPPRSNQSHADLCSAAGISFELLDRIYSGFGLARPKPNETARAEDLEIIAGIPILLTSGLGEAEVLRAARVWGEGLRRVAQHQVHSFHELVEEPFRRQGLSDDEALGAALSQVGVRLIPYVTRLVGWLYRRHFESYQIEHRLGHIERALDAAGLHRKAAPLPETCAFVDLSGYTRLTEELGDTAASQIALRLAELIQEVTSRHQGLMVKMLGDGVHLHFHDPRRAVLASLELVESAEPHGLPPARVGVNAGPMTYTDGDYYGLAVIIAARFAEKAGPNEVLIGQGAAGYGPPGGVRFDAIPPMSLKGIAQSVAAFRAVRDAT